MDIFQFNEIKKDIAEVLSAVKAKHSLVGIAIFLLVQYNCMSSQTTVIVESELKKIPICTQPQTGK